MGENNSKWNNWQRINFQNIQAAHATQYQKNNLVKKLAEHLTAISPEKTYRWPTNTWKDVQHHSILEKCKSKSKWDITSHWSESVSSVQSFSCVWLFVTPWTTASQAFLSITNSQSLPKLISIEFVMPSNHLILCCPLSSCPLSQDQGLFQWVST